MVSSSPEVLAAHRQLLQQLGALLHSIPAATGGGLEFARLGPLPCWSVESPPATAQALARTLARRGQLGLLIADDPPTRRRTLVVSLAPIRPAIVDRFDPTALPLIRLARAAVGESRLGAALAVASALDVDAAGRRAFRALRVAIETVTGQLDGRIRQETRHAWVLLQVTRLLFLRFVESEGWLDGRPDFLRHTIDDCLAARRDPARHLLRPLFFGMLNRPIADRSPRVKAFGRVPFLNGGLFEPHPIERGGRWQLATDGWLRLFELVVDRIEVTLDQGDAGDRVNPELLGRVFEGVMDPEERRDGGAFYTPAPLVDALVREAYACHLESRLTTPSSSLTARLEDPDPELLRMLLDIRVLDPAVGSGAFLVGALQVARGPGGNLARTRALVTRNLFGVDRNPAAVRITELRLWLEILRAMRGRPPSRVAPLPNLDANVRAGDALLDPLAGLRLPPGALRSLAKARREACQCHGPARQRALRRLRSAECAAIALALEQSERRLDRALRELLDDAASPMLFGAARGLDQHGRERLTMLRRAVRTVRAERRRLQRDGVAPAFALESAFGTELDRGGFDLVVGNPPWVRAERLPATTRAALASRYRWWRGGGSGWRHLPDLSVAFLERAMEVTARGGTLAMLIPSKLATASYATTCRGALSHGTTLHLVADLSTDPRAGFEATTYPMAVVASRTPPAADHRVRRTLASPKPATPQRLWRDRGTWSLAPESVLTLAARLGARHPALAASLVPALGVKTGANAIYLDPPSTLRRWTRPVVRGRDIAGEAGPSHRLLWPADPRGEPMPVLPPALEAFLAPHRAALERRRDLTTGPWWRLFRTTTATARWRVIWADIARELRVIPLESPEPVPLNSCYVIATTTREEMLALAAWLNSAPIRTLASLEAEPAAGGFRRFGARVVGTVPLPEGALLDEVLIRAAGAPGHRETVDRCVAAWLELDHADLTAISAVGATGR